MTKMHINITYSPCVKITPLTSVSQVCSMCWNHMFCLREMFSMKIILSVQMHLYSKKFSFNYWYTETLELFSL